MQSKCNGRDDQKSTKDFRAYKANEKLVEERGACYWCAHGGNSAAASFLKHPAFPQWAYVGKRADAAGGEAPVTETRPFLEKLLGEDLEEKDMVACLKSFVEHHTANLGKQRHFLIVCDGNISCGKTTFLDEIGNSQHLPSDVQIFREPVAKNVAHSWWSLLEKFYKDMKNGKGPAAVIALENAIWAHHRKIATQRESHVITERCCDSSVGVFLQNALQKKGTLPEGPPVLTMRPDMPFFCVRCRWCMHKQLFDLILFLFVSLNASQLASNWGVPFSSFPGPKDPAVGPSCVPSHGFLKSVTIVQQNVVYVIENAPFKISPMLLLLVLQGEFKKFMADLSQMNADVAHKPTLVLYFRLSVEEAMRRIKKRAEEEGREFEKEITEEYLQELDCMYEELYKDREDVIRLDSNMPPDEIKREVAEALQNNAAKYHRVLEDKGYSKAEAHQKLMHMTNCFRPETA